MKGTMDTKTQVKQDSTAATLARLRDARWYQACHEWSVRRATPHSPAAVALAVTYVDLLIPGPGKFDVANMLRYRALSTREIGADPFLAAVRKHMPRGRYLQVTVWDDGTVALTTSLRKNSSPDVWWALMSQSMAYAGEELSDYTEARDIARDKP